MCYTRQYQNDKMVHPLRHRLRDATSPKVGGLDSLWEVSDYMSKALPLGELDAKRPERVRMLK